MPNKKSKEESGKALLADVKKEMAAPRMALSARAPGRRKSRKEHLSAAKEGGVSPAG
jgi:hypothetical protein